jgi:hypothetical protein
LILKRAPVGWNQNDYDVVEDGVIVGRTDTARGSRLRGHARGGDGGVC